jgi:hypothetical protein
MAKIKTFVVNLSLTISLNIDSPSMPGKRKSRITTSKSVFSSAKIAALLVLS